MKLVFQVFPFSLFFFLLFTHCNPPENPPQQKITIATAANMQFAIKSLIKSFSSKNQITCNLVLSSSGKLTAQILEGAPYDIFMAADEKYPEQIFKRGLSKERPKVYAEGQLVLWSMKKNVTPTLRGLGQNDIQHIAIANPQTAPYGAAAVATLQHHKLFNAVQKKLVYGESISQTNQFITSNAAEIGFTAMSVVLSPQMKGKGQWIPINRESYPTIKQSVLLIQRDKGINPAANAFYNFLFSPEAKLILKDFGYLVNE